MKATRPNEMDVTRKRARMPCGLQVVRDGYLTELQRATIVAGPAYYLYET